MTKEKECRTCKNTFTPSSRHADCPRCRSKKQKGTCVDCGGECARQAERCVNCYLKSDRSGENSSSWKGGRTIHRKGYVQTYVDGKYVFDHILIMEEHIGRKLLEGENVHHINGIKDDNRIENLELWTRPQPAGIRAIDALMWAERIIERYAPLKENNLI